ncbi:MAG: hypothetical protein HFE68_02770 [Erysipelotrichaceae bacterium]|nr:hypothetical protein [Erysipelotrichaceae bacterium]MCI9312269.1 hypothetical protein [Erysipelotrichaceae bacterium]
MRFSYHNFRFIQRLFAYFFLPFINLTALFLADPYYENITHIAYANHHLPFALLWAITAAGYLWISAYVFLLRMHYHKRSTHLLLGLACIAMFISVCIPYEEQSALLSRLHVNLAMAATILYILLGFYLLIHFTYREPMLAYHALTIYSTLIASLALLFLWMGMISTLLEVLFVITMGIAHCRLLDCIDERNNLSRQ